MNEALSPSLNNEAAHDEPVHKGLKGVVLDVSEICEIDDEQDKLRYRGYDVGELANSCEFEDIVALLLDGELPSKEQFSEVWRALELARSLSPAVCEVIDAMPGNASPMGVLRTAVSAIGCSNANFPGMSPRQQAVLLTAQIPLIVGRIRANRNRVSQPKMRPGSSQAAIVLSQLTGKEVDQLDPLDIAVMDKIMIVHAEHELNASCFAARVTASTLTDVAAAVTSAISALAGSLHGGANEKVLRAALQIGEPDRADSFVETALSDKQKVYGFGQRGCKAEDPRAILLRSMAEEVAARRNGSEILPVLYAMNAAMRKRRDLWPNVDFYSAAILHDLGIDTDLFTPLFACSRVVGWSSHVMEQWVDNRIIRPKAKYIGLAYRPIPKLDE